MGNFLSFSKPPNEPDQSSTPTDSVPETQTTQSPQITVPPLLDSYSLIDNKPTKSSIVNPENCFSLVSYNILAECYAHFLSKTIHEKFLDIHYRSPLIVPSLFLSYNSNISNFF